MFSLIAYCVREINIFILPRLENIGIIGICKKAAYTVDVPAMPLRKKREKNQEAPGGCIEE